MSATKTVMCIEDDEEMIDLVELVLREPNVEMRSVVGADEALEYLRGNTPDLVLLDLYMPRMSGWEVYRRIRSDARLRQTPVIVLSACREQIAAALGHDLSGISDYICKPFSVAELRASVDRALGIAQ